MTGNENGNGNGTGEGGHASGDPYAVGNDPALSAQVRMELLQTLHSRTGYSATLAEEELNARDVQAEFARAFADRGLSARSLPDLLAGNLMVMWSVVHDAELPGSAVAAALVRQFTAMIAGTAEAADPALRQLMGEALLFETALTLEAHREARASDNRAMLKQMADSAQVNVLAQRSINLRKTVLTERGMQRR